MIRSATGLAVEVREPSWNTPVYAADPTWRWNRLLRDVPRDGVHLLIVRVDESAPENRGEFTSCGFTARSQPTRADQQ
jgi:hypothetical protein